MTTREMYNLTLVRYNEARNAAYEAVVKAKHYPVIDSDGYPDWEACYFGDTAAAYFDAQAELERVRTALRLENEQKCEERKAARKAFEEANPDIVAERKRKANLKRYRTLRKNAEQELAALIAEKTRLIEHYSIKIAELEKEFERE